MDRFKVRIPEDQRTKWLQALRSGSYNQAQNTLYDPVKKGYCCLGVLCHINGAATEVMEDYSMPYDLMRHEEEGIEETLDFVEDDWEQVELLEDREFQDMSREWQYEDYIPTEKLFPTYLAYLNDKLNKNFDEIADAIERVTVPA